MELRLDMKDVTPARTQQGILDTNHGQGGAMDVVHRLPMMVIQVRVYCNVFLRLSCSFNVISVPYDNERSNWLTIYEKEMDG